MILRELIQKKLEELKAENRDAKFAYYSDTEITRNSFSVELFAKSKIPLDAEVIEVKIQDLMPGEKVKGIMLAYKVVPPRCRKWKNADLVYAKVC